MKKEELDLLDRALMPSWIDRILGRPKLTTERFLGRQFVEEYRVAVEKCFVFADFNEEYPLYLLDVGGLILILFGQWLYDPNTVSVSDSTLDSWYCKNGFPSKFTIRFHSQSGTVFNLNVDGDSFADARVLAFDPQFKSLRACQAVSSHHHETLIRDLQSAGLWTR